MTKAELLQIAKPILFNGEMVRAILDGRKTQTRRILKSYMDYIPKDAEFGFDFFTRERGKNEIACRGTFGEHYGECFIKMPFIPNDILYVRETWSKIISAGEFEDKIDYVYKATDQYPFGKKGYIVKFRWRPSIHMPKEAARIFLRVTGVRVERLNSIDGRGVLAEGVDNGASNPTMGARWENMQRMAFSELWDSTIKPMDKHRYGWAANPWVWVIEFKRITESE